MVLKRIFDVIIFVFLNTYIAAQSSMYHRLIGARIDGVWKVKYGVQTPIQCCYICSQQNDCVVVNYNNDSDVCELLTKVSPTEKFDVTSDPAWTVYYSNITDIDVKSGASAWQSSTVHNGLAQLAIDGIKLTRYSDYSCTHTNNIPNQWWMVDFGRVYLVSGVVVWNRSDPGATDRLRNIVITVSMTEEEIDLPSNVCTLYPGPSTPFINPITMECTKEMEGRYLKVLKNDPIADMNICEIEFY